MGRMFCVPHILKEKGNRMKKVVSLVLLGVIAISVMGCAHKCESEPIVEQNHKLIVPPHFGQMPQ